MRAMRLLAALTILLVTGCSSVNARWASAQFTGISYGALFGAVTTSIAGAGFAVGDADAQSAHVDTDWVYGTSQRVVRGPSRRRVHAVIEPVADRTFNVRMRVEEEVIRKGGMLATEIRESKDWESFEDNYDDAEFMMAKLAALLEVYRSRETRP
jgi:hypothetical protein